MNLNAAVYWIAVGLLILGLNSEYRQGRFVALHQTADRIGAVLCEATADAEGLIGDATSSLREWPNSWDNAVSDRAEVIRAQILAQRDILRAQADMRRADMEQLRWSVQSGMNAGSGSHHIAVICPKTRQRIVVSNGLDLDLDLPTVETSDNF